MTKLRLIDGIPKMQLADFPETLRSYFDQEIKALCSEKEIIESTDHYYIPSEKRIMTDRISQALFYVD